MSLRRLAWGLFALYVALQFATLWLIWDGPDSAGDSIAGFVVIGYAFVGALVASRQPGQVVGWLLLAIAVLFAVDLAGEAYAYYPSSAPGYLLILVPTSLLAQVWIALAVVFLPLVFPDGRLLSRRWRPVVWLGGVAVLVSVAGSAVGSDELAVSNGSQPPVKNPVAVGGVVARVASLATSVGNYSIAVAVGFGIVSLVLRFRRARGVQRQQLKLFAYACLVALSGLALAAAAELRRFAWTDLVGAIGWVTFLLGILVGVPVAIGVGILRHRLYDIDVVINRTLVYGSLTAVLAGTYVGLVLLMRLVLDPLAGQSDLAVAGSTLAVAALVRPARRRIQGVVDRRFYRARYDAAQTLLSFNARLRSELDLDALALDLRRAVQETVEPAHVSLWLREGAT